MHDDRDSLAFAAKPLLDIDAVVDAYVEADHVRCVGARLTQREEYCNDAAAAERLERVRMLLLKWADAREASVAAMLEG